MYKFAFYVPIDKAEIVKQAVFSTGAGSIGLYEHCCFETLGKGQFRPLVGAQPYSGQISSLKEVEELKVELVATKEQIHEAVIAMKESHPYEEPAYEVWKLEDF